MDKTFKGLNANILKYIAAAAMLIDHIGWAFVQTNTVMGQAMHLIGRFTAPIMCYFIAEGYYHTKNIEKYLLRLGIFAAILHYPFVIAELFQGNRIQFINGLIFVKPQFSITNSSVIFTLFLGLCALTIWKTQKNSVLKIISVIGICIASLFGDWMFFGVLWVLGFGIFKGNLKKQLIFYYIVAALEIAGIVLPKLLSGAPVSNVIWQSGLLIAPLFILLYNGKRGSAHPFNKWFFYVFYPLHLLIIGILKIYIF